MNRMIVALAVAVAVAGGMVIAAVGDAGKPVYGTVVNVDASAGKIVIKPLGNDPDAQEVTIATDEKTTVTVSDKAATLADIKIGMIARITPPSGTATDIRAYPPRTASQPASAPAGDKPLYGTVTTVYPTDNKVDIKTPGGSVTVVTDANTTITVAGKPGTLSDIKAGMILRVTPPTGTAADVRAFQPTTQPTPAPSTQPRLLYGTVQSVDPMAGKIVIKTTGDNGQEVTVATDANTKFILADKPAATLADIKTGMILRVTPPAGTATEIRAFTVTAK